MTEPVTTDESSGGREEPEALVGIHLDPVQPRQLYELILERIKDSIHQGLWKPGGRLPSERALATQLNVSRPTVREAIAALQTDGILETRRGSGSYVSARALEILATDREPSGRDEEGAHPLLPAATGFLRDVSPVALLEVRGILDPAIASLSASRYREVEQISEYLALMRRPLDPADPEDRKVWSEADRLFHRELALMTDNPILIRLADFVATVMAQPLWRRLRDEALGVPNRIREYADEHFEIFDSVRAEDPEGASYFARRHVMSVRRHMGLLE